MQTVLRDVKLTDNLGSKLSDRRVREIESQFRGYLQQLKGYVDYFMDHDPLASWRQVIVGLDEAGEKEGAEKIRYLAEALTGEISQRLC